MIFSVIELREISSKFVTRLQYIHVSPVEYVNDIVDSFVVLHYCLDESLVINIIMSGLSPNGRFVDFRYYLPTTLVQLRPEILNVEQMQRSVLVYDRSYKQQGVPDKISQIFRQDYDYRKLGSEMKDKLYNHPFGNNSCQNLVFGRK